MFLLAVGLFVAMVVVAVWGYVRIPEGSRFRFQAGAPTPSFDGTMAKESGLFVWLLLGGVVLGGAAVAREESEVTVVIGCGVLAFLLLMEFLSVRRLTR